MASESFLEFFNRVAFSYVKHNELLNIADIALEKLHFVMGNGYIISFDKNDLQKPDDFFVFPRSFSYMEDHLSETITSIYFKSLVLKAQNMLERGKEQENYKRLFKIDGSLFSESENQ